MILGDGELLCRPVNLKECGDWVWMAAVAGEDKRFFRHPGVDPIALLRAAAQNVSSGKIVSGASTISTLVIKLTGGRRQRNLLTKCIEAFRALQMERVATKREIMEQYLNRAPFGSNLNGIAAAARRYYGKEPRDLTLAEAALLMGVPQSPARLRPDRFPAAARDRMAQILERMEDGGLISEEEKQQALEQPVSAGFHPLPRVAPHFCDLISSRYPEEKTVRTFLDPDLQRMIEEVLRKDARSRSAAGISGGSVVVIDVPSGEVRALAGSPDYADPVSGQVNCAVSSRSPGSALKPFIYALAFDRGLCTPETILADVPVAWSDYRPENFDGSFRGAVTVRSALINSLNIPAVRLAKGLGVPELLQLFRQAGLSTLNKPAGHYGLGLAIGDGEVTLLDLTNAYAALARGGLFFPCHLTAADKSFTGKRLFSPGAAWMITDILRNKNRRASPDNIPTASTCPEFAWKTGTSNGYRDAWAIGYTPEYAVGVWIGNPNGTPAKYLTGSTMAAPVLKDIFRRLYPKGNSPPFPRPEEVKTRTVCALTGLLPTRNCPGTIEGDYIPGISPTGFCGVHKRVKVPDGSPDEGYRVVEKWPPEIAIFLEEQKKGEQSLGTEQEKSGAIECNRTPLRITGPLSGETFRRMDTGLTGQNRIALSATGGAGNIYWFENGIYLGTSGSGESLFREIDKKGELRIACIDDEGHGDRVKITVE